MGATGRVSSAPAGQVLKKISKSDKGSVGGLRALCDEIAVMRPITSVTGPPLPWGLGPSAGLPRRRGLGLSAGPRGEHGIGEGTGKNIQLNI